MCLCTWIQNSTFTIPFFICLSPFCIQLFYTNLLMYLFVSLLIFCLLLVCHFFFSAFFLFLSLSFFSFLFLPVFRFLPRKTSKLNTVASTVPLVFGTVRASISCLFFFVQQTRCLTGCSLCLLVLSCFLSFFSFFLVLSISALFTLK